MDKILLNELKNSLEKEHDKLVAELKKFADPDPNVKDDWNARFPKFEEKENYSHSASDIEADEIEEYEMLLGAEQSLESRLLEINHALERIQKGTYGICLKCGKEIPLERLKANPAAGFHVEHSKK